MSNRVSGVRRLVHLEYELVSWWREDSRHWICVTRNVSFCGRSPFPAQMLSFFWAKHILELIAQGPYNRPQPWKLLQRIASWISKKLLPHNRKHKIKMDFQFSLQPAPLVLLYQIKTRIPFSLEEIHMLYILLPRMFLKRFFTQVNCPPADILHKLW